MHDSFIHHVTFHIGEYFLLNLIEISILIFFFFLKKTNLKRNFFENKSKKEHFINLLDRNSGGNQALALKRPWN